MSGRKSDEHLNAGGEMDILVRVEEFRTEPVVLAHVDSVPSPLERERSARDVVTFYGEMNADSLALALAAVVEGHRAVERIAGAMRHLRIWPERGAIGDESWLDDQSGEVVRRDVVIPLDRLTETARELLAEFGQGIRRLVAGLLMPEWPEGSPRAINFNMQPAQVPGAKQRNVDGMLDNFREAQGLAFDIEGD
jgi:hypothetical protein